MATVNPANKRLLGHFANRMTSPLQASNECSALSSAVAGFSSALRKRPVVIRMIGPITKPMNPNAATPPNRPKNTTKPFMDVLPLSSNGRSTLSAMLMPNTPMSSNTTPCPIAPDNSRAITAGTQTSAAPTTGSNEENAITAPQKIGAGILTNQKAMPPMKP